VRGSLTGTAPSFGRRMPTSRPPVRIDALDWLAAVDKEIARWYPGAGTVDRLKSMAAQSWRPQDCAKLDRYSAKLADYAQAAAVIVNDAVTTVALRGHACPVCDQKQVLRHRDGESIRSAALVVSELGAQCLACSAEWTTEQLPFLATLLGREPLPA
jgi:hypothetical protein